MKIINTQLDPSHLYAEAPWKCSVTVDSQEETNRAIGAILGATMAVLGEKGIHPYTLIPDQGTSFYTNQVENWGFVYSQAVPRTNNLALRFSLQRVQMIGETVLNYFGLRYLMRRTSTGLLFEKGLLISGEKKVKKPFQVTSKLSISTEQSGQILKIENYASREDSSIELAESPNSVRGYKALLDSNFANSLGVGFTPLPNLLTFEQVVKLQLLPHDLSEARTIEQTDFSPIKNLISLLTPPQTP